MQRWSISLTAKCWAGKTGLHKMLNKFVIGRHEARSHDALTEAGNLLIIGNRSQAQEHALRQGQPY